MTSAVAPRTGIEVVSKEISEALRGKKEWPRLSHPDCVAEPGSCSGGYTVCCKRAGREANSELCSC